MRGPANAASVRVNKRKQPGSVHWRRMASHRGDGWVGVSATPAKPRASEDSVRSGGAKLREFRERAPASLEPET